MSDQESVVSFNSQNTSMVDVEGQQPQQYVPSKTNSRANQLKLTKTETVKSLQDLGVTSAAPVPDINAPQTAKNNIFPEEYTMETPSGLVPVATLQSMGRTASALSRTRTKQLNRTATNSSSTGKEEMEEEETEEREDQSGENELDPEIEFVTFVTGDPENPHNWPSWVRWSYTVLLSILVICVAYGSACISGGLGTVEKKFHVGMEAAILSCSLMVIGFSLGPLIWSPVSDLYGRRVAYFVSMGLYVIFNIPCALAPNLGCLLACRFLCGVWSSSGLCLVGGSIADMFPSETRGKAIAFFAFAPYVGPVVGPLVNGFISVSTGRMDLIFWVNMAFAGVMWIISSAIPETYAPVILKRKAARLRKETGNPKIMTEQEAQGVSMSEMMRACLLRPLYFAVTEPVLVATCFYVCLIYSLLYAFFFAFPVIFGELYGYKDNLVGLMFIPIVIGALWALATTFYCENKYLQIVKQRKPTPEDRLLGAKIGAPFAAIALWILGATAYKHIIWVGPASAGLAFGFGMVLIYYSLNNYIIDCYVQYASSALATKVFLRSAGGAAFPLFTIQMYHKLNLHWGSWLLAFISTAMIALPFAFSYWGKGLRHKLSKKDYSIDSVEM
ncbi:Tpo2p [Saccharomyces cerevisiae YJM1573]|nr:Tpo2p [Saccharomyces cerevisiae YJM451]AJR82671.1 Tpo2p [Saccharomyces cerevisiae YJM456]AJR85166.1 Tpo2p [Saccharomyces cerevisiae YJM627]AJR92558.1 Tpo2p [Saccharomyces cerevisiae YJM1083]AJR93559.1 Tpo2p [Saccharomyces cerevisiae YJM1133]AJR95057.1 Tpo2p [Saccharomyces cerevisiae YJM1202]AJR96958.1 Tpo2p [Saccharomyces cerevisiae YJM1248]AJR99947.1 Tpo2p [Saccharomyces cerevisiae YJM1419]AJS00939.1 Tpo2p [Saccharomyces cerevisiae YJM1434]AJS01430.1 Tpo2p [Saccharomyces cerevisiae YJM